MTILFHRVAAPAYYGGLPVDFDYLNDPVANGFPSSVPVVVDTQKVGGPNEGIYLVAFGEDASSANANRGLEALGENTDYLDDLMRRDIAVPARTANVTAVGTVTSITLPAQTFVGNSGSYPLDRLFSLLDSDGDEIINASGVKCVVTAITGAAVGDGFSGVSINLTVSPGIPSGTVYTVQYAVRGNLATFPVDALTSITIRASQETSAGVEDAFRRLQGNSYAWDHAWELDIYTLAHRGLAGMYGKRTDLDGSPPAGYGLPGDVLGEYGAGAWAIRSGPALSMIANQSEDSNFLYADWTQDPQGAMFRSISRDYSAFPDSTDKPMGMAVGFLHLGNRHASTTEDESDLGTGPGRPGFAAFMATANSLTAATTPTNFRTYLPTGVTGTLDVEDSTHLKLTLASGWFWKDFVGLKQTAVAVGQDMLELVFPDGTIRTLVITATTSSNDKKVLLQYPDGGRGNDGDMVAGAPLAVTVTKWIRSYFFVGDGAPQLRHAIGAGAVDVTLQNFQVVQPPVLVDGSGHVDIAPNAFFGAYDASVSRTALAWGGFVTNTTTGSGAYTAAGYLRADGSVDALAVRATTVTATQVDTKYVTKAIYTINNGLSGLSFAGSLYSLCDWTTSNSGAALTMTLTSMQANAEYIFIIRRTYLGGACTLAITAAGYTVYVDGKAASFNTVDLPPARSAAGGADGSTMLVVRTLGTKMFVTVAGEF